MGTSNTKKKDKNQIFSAQRLENMAPEREHHRQTDPDELSTQSQQPDKRKASTSPFTAPSVRTKPIRGQSSKAKESQNQTFSEPSQVLSQAPISPKEEVSEEKERSENTRSLQSPKKTKKLTPWQDSKTYRETDVVELQESPSTHEQENANHPSKGSRLGRYILLDDLGEGGMGQVFIAFDTELERKIAIKLLHPQTESILAEQNYKRLYREAKAMARLSHPNVVSIYDVGQTDDGQPFLAMEYIQGETLKQWIRSESRSLEACYTAFLQAGQGLQAAHEAGLIHRDFKPANVLLGQDGQFRVTDFGLARGNIVTEPPPTRSTSNEESESYQSGPKSWETSFTETGYILGTPAYMSPEQFDGHTTDEQSDQFSFCVALFEAVYGKRPFSSRTPEKRMTAHLEVQSGQSPSGQTIPGWLKRILQKGLQPHPEARYPSMSALLEDLRQGAHPPKRNYYTLYTVAFTVLLGALFLFQNSTAPCQGGTEKYAKVWSSQVQKKVRSAFQRVGIPSAMKKWQRVSERLRAYGNLWNKQYQSVCKATHVHKEQSTRALDLRMNCLYGQLRELGALLKLFAQADKRIIKRALSIVYKLDEPKSCQDLKALQRLVPLPKDPTQRKVIEYLQEKLPRLKMLFKVGRYRTGLRMTKRLYKKVKVTKYAPLEAMYLYRLFRFEYSLGLKKKSQQTGLKTLWKAQEYNDIVIQVQTYIHLASNARDFEDFQRARHLTKHAESIIHQLNDKTRYQIMIYNNYALNAIGRDLPKQASLLLEKAHKTAIKRFGVRHPAPVVISNNLGLSYERIHRWNDAEKIHRENIQNGIAVYGKEHPYITFFRANLAHVMMSQRKFQAAHKIFQQDLLQRIQIFGPQHVRTANTYTALGNLYLRTKQLDKALYHAQQALYIRIRAYGRKNSTYARSLLLKGKILYAQGKTKQALMLWKESLAIFKLRFKGLHILKSDLHLLMAQTKLDHSQVQQALKHLEKAQAFYKKGKHFERRAQILYYQAKAYHLLNKEKHAKALLEKAQQLYQAWEHKNPDFIKKLQEWLPKLKGHSKRKQSPTSRPKTAH